MLRFVTRGEEVSAGHVGARQALALAIREVWPELGLGTCREGSDRGSMIRYRRLEREIMPGWDV